MNRKKSTTTGLTAEIRIKRCYGCGAILQDKDPNDIGYIPTEKLHDDDEKLCVRCFKLRNYSTLKKTPDFNIDYVTILDHAKDEKALIVYVLNAFSLAASSLNGIGKYLPDNVLVVLNKRDILPNSYSDEYLIQYTKNMLSKENINPLDIIISSASNYTKNIDILMEEINKYRQGRSVYFIGSYQVGKSSIINNLLKTFINKTGKMITTSCYPGTTLDVISIPLDNESYIYDTPGIYNDRSAISILEPELGKYILPRTLIKPERFSTKDGQSFIISNFFRFDFVKGDKSDFTFFKSNNLTILRSKINKADSLIKLNSNEQIKSNKIKDVNDLVKTTFIAKPNTTNVIRVLGLCIIEFVGKNQEIHVYAPKGVEVVLETGLSI